MIERPRGILDPTELTERPYAREGDGGRREGAKWFTGIALAAALSAFIAALSLFQATSEGTAESAHQRALAALTEIDLLIERNYDDLQLQAETAQRGETVRLAGFPVDVALTPAEVEDAEPAELRALLIERGADRLYAEGTSALRDEAEAAGSVGLFSVAGITDRGLGLLEDDRHALFGVATLALAAVCGLLAALLLALTRGFGRAGAIGVVMLAGAVPAVVVAGGLHLYARAAGGGDARFIAQEFAAIVEELSWIGVRNGLAFGAAGLALAVAAFAGGRLLERPARERSEPRVEARAR